MKRNLVSKTRLSQGVSLGLILALLSACGPQTANSSLHDDPEVSNRDAVQQVLGLGIDHSRNVKLSPCIDVSRYVYSGMSSSNVSYLGDYSSAQLLDEKRIGVSAGFNLLGLVKAKVSGDVTTDLATTDDTSSFIYKFDISGKSAVLDSSALNAKGYAAYQKNDPALFRSECGDSYVEQLKIGAQLFIGLKYDFTSREDKEKLRLLLKGSALWGLIKFSKTWTKEESDLLRNVHVRVTAHQVGGDPRVLEALKGKMEASGCPGNAMEPCLVTLNSLLQYAADTFPKQLNEMKVSADANVGPAILDIVTVPYSNQALFDPSQKNLVSIPSLDDGSPMSIIAQNVENLLSLRSDLAIELSRRTGLLAFELNDAERSNLNSAKETLNGLLAETDGLAAKCLIPTTSIKDQDQCLLQIDDLETRGHAALVPAELAPRS